MKFLRLLALLLLPSIAMALPLTQKAQSVLNSLSLNEKIGQLILVGFRGDSITNSESLVRDITEVGVGSVILFDYDAALKVRDRNIKSPDQLKSLTRDMQSLAKIGLFISVDEEGGLVSRLKSVYGFRQKPSPEELGQGSASQTQQQAQWLAHELKQNGINVNFAPGVDVKVNPENPVIGKIKRSFSPDENQVTLHARAFIQGQKQEGILSVIKHFPGHGSSTSDSHYGLVDVTQTWSARELVPFQQMITSNDVQLLMSAHVFNQNLDPQYPATLSHRVLTGLLREQMGYRGVIISDDLNMGAIVDHFGFKNAIELALHAGVDILLYGNNLIYDKDTAKKAQEAVLELIAEGKISEEMINEKALRVLSLKDQQGLL